MGQGVDRSGRLSRDAIDRTLTCLAEYGRALADHRVEATAAVCTSAARDAVNGQEFLDAAERLIGVRPRVISGDEEARLTFEGAASGLTVSGSLLVVDVGGGSTEVISGQRGHPPACAVSLQIGSVRLTERHVVTDPPTQEAIERIREDVRLALASSEPAPRDATVIGVAGTVTTLAAVADSLDVYDSARVHGRELSRARIERLAAELTALPLAARRQVAGVDPARADIIVAGAWLVLETLVWAGADRLLVSDRGVRWGLLEAMQRQRVATAGR